METWTEGLKEYRVLEEVKNTYYMDVEYHVLRRNKIPELLPVQCRDQDGTCRLLYEISGLKCMKTMAEGHGFSFQECTVFLKDCSLLIKALDKYMLDISQISFDPADIFQNKDGHYCWAYTPVSLGDTSGKIMKLFEWLLSVIDYGDIKTVQFTYHAYWYIRNHTFSEEVLDYCLNYKGGDIAQYTSESYDDFFGHQSLLQDADGFSQSLPQNADDFSQPLPQDADDFSQSLSQNADNFSQSLPHNAKDFSQPLPQNADGFSQPQWGYGQRKEVGTHGAFHGDLENQYGLENHSGMENRHGVRNYGIQILCISIEALMIIGLSILLVLGIRQGIVSELKYIYILMGIVVLILGDCIWHLHKNRTREKKDDQVIFSHKEIPAPSYNFSWEGEGGTEVLGIRKDMLQPALKNKKTGRICAIDTFPFFIGSDTETNNLVIEEAAVSRRHAVIIRGRQTGYYELQDLCSTNGTWLNQKALIYKNPVKLRPGDMIRFASVDFEFIMLDCPMGEYREGQDERRTGSD